MERRCRYCDKRAYCSECIDRAEDACPFFAAQHQESCEHRIERVCVWPRESQDTSHSACEEVEADMLAGDADVQAVPSESGSCKRDFFFTARSCCWLNACREKIDVNMCSEDHQFLVMFCQDQPGIGCPECEFGDGRWTTCKIVSRDDTTSTNRMCEVTV